MKNIIALFFLFIFTLPLDCFSALPKTLDTNSESNALRTLLLEHGYKELPLTLSKDKNFLLIYASLDDAQINKPFILDTGSTLSSMDQQIEDRYKFNKQGKSITASGGGGGYFQTYNVIVHKLKIDNFETDNQLFVIQHYSHIKVDNKHIAGMIGLDFLRKHHAIIDFKNNRIFFRINNLKPELERTILEKTLKQMQYESIQLKRTSKNYQTLLLKLNDEKPVMFMLDSGVPPSIMLDYNYAKSIKVDVKGKPTIGKGSSNAIMKLYNTKVNKLRIGPITDGPLPAIVTTGLEFAKIGVPVLGIIGLNWLRSHQAIMDTVNDVLFVKSTNDTENNSWSNIH